MHATSKLLSVTKAAHHFPAKLEAQNQLKPSICILATNTLQPAAKSCSGFDQYYLLQLPMSGFLQEFVIKVDDLIIEPLPGTQALHLPAHARREEAPRFRRT